MTSFRRVSTLLALAVCFAAAALAEPPPPALAAEKEAEPEKGPLHGLEYRLLGPAIGGRVSRVAGVPGDPSTWFAATAAGGVWRSTNGGHDWQPVFDDQPVSSIGSIAVAPSDPNVVYAGAGEANIRGNVGKGNGIYKSTDRGKTWRRCWRSTGRSARWPSIRATPTSPSPRCSAAPSAPDAERGVYRTTDGGASWQQRALRRRRRPAPPTSPSTRQPAHRLRRLLADAPLPVEARERRPRQRPVGVARRRRHAGSG